MSEKNLSSGCEIERYVSKFVSCGHRRPSWILVTMLDMNKCLIIFHKKILLYKKNISKKCELSICEIETDI